MAETTQGKEKMQKPSVRRLRMEADLAPDERAVLEAARERVRGYRTHYECVVEYLRYCELLVQLGMKPAGYTPSIHRMQQELGIACWRTVKRCFERAQEEEASSRPAA